MIKIIILKILVIKLEEIFYNSHQFIRGIGTAAFIWPFIKSMNPAEDTLALGSTEVDISEISIGQAKTVKWQVSQYLLEEEQKKKY